MNNIDAQLKVLREKKHNLIKSLEWAVLNNDKLFAQILEIELKSTLKEINKLKQNQSGK